MANRVYERPSRSPGGAEGPWRILHVAQRIRGGIASYLEEVDSFQQRVHGPQNVRFLVAQEERRYVPEIPDQRVDLFPSSRRSASALASFLRAYARTCREFRPEVVHLHSTFAGLCRIPTLIRRRGSPAVVYCPHGWSFEMSVPSWQRALYRCVERVLSVGADRIIAISRHEMVAATRAGLPAAKCEVVRNGIADFPADEHPDPRCCGTASVNYLFVGRPDRQKGLDILLEAWGVGRPAGGCLHVVGAEAESCRSLPRQHGDGVVFYGWQERRAVQRMMAAADAVVMPSRWEGFGLVAIEALRTGTPVLASRIGALPEIIEDGVSGRLFDLSDPEALARTLRETPKEAWAAMRSSARAHYVRTFSADALEAGLDQAYRAAVRARRRIL